MKEYEVKITEIFNRIVTVPVAQSERDALDIIEQQYADHKIVLGAEDFKGAKIEIIKRKQDNEMKRLTDTERLDVIISLLSDQQIDEYIEQCAELERNYRHGNFHLPAECGYDECPECCLNDHEKHDLGCPYID